MTIGIVLAGGRGKRFGAEAIGVNKTAATLSGKPLVMYGVELFEKTTDKVVVVVGALKETVQEAVGINRVEWAIQDNPAGTGDALKTAVLQIEKLGLSPESVAVGYADHMMFYTPEVVTDLLKLMSEEKAAMGMLSTSFDDPNKLAWGRIIRGADGHVSKIVEQKNATEEEKRIKEVNPGFYCFEFEFLARVVREIKMNPTTGEYLLTDLAEIAGIENKKIVAHQVPFSVVGYGINTREELEQDKALMLE